MTRKHMTDQERFTAYQYLNDNSDNMELYHRGAGNVAEALSDETGYEYSTRVTYRMIVGLGLQDHYLTRHTPEPPEQPEQPEQQDLLAEDLDARIKTIESSLSTLFNVSQRHDAELAEVRKSLSILKTNAEALGLAVRAITKHLSANGFSLKAAGYHYYGLPTDRGHPEYIINMLREGASERAHNR